jgi:hypothetical protein
MRQFLFLCCLLAISSHTQAQDLKYYLPDSVTYNPAIPKPKDVIYHEVGEWHVTHDRLVNYMKTVAEAAPERIKLETMGLTYESRPQVLLIITSPNNHKRLEEIRQQHLKLSDPASAAGMDVSNMPIVVWIGHSIHGNEPSGSNAALLTAYHLAAAQGAAIDDLLEHTVILLDPSFNPDGLQRFSTWANQHKSKNLVSDPSSREYNEVWPGGRFNHYWFDLNRDWLPTVHVESQNRLKWFHQWKPNILTDHHEQGSNATFFFQPGVPSRVNPLTPAKNQELTARLAKFHAQYLDRIGSLYFTKENYDDFYYGKGSTYPDINGAIGILFEQASSRGHLQQTSNGLLSFPFTIRNQFITALSTMEGARQLRTDFLNYQKAFYVNSLAEAASDPVKAYVFGDAKDVSKTNLFLQLLRRQQINVYPLKKDWQQDGQTFYKQAAFAVPTNQVQYKVIKTIFEKTFNFKDSLFYDITSWTMPLAFGLPYAGLNSQNWSNELVDMNNVNQLKTNGEVLGGKSNYAYLINWSAYHAPAFLYEVLQAGMMVKAATTPFSLEIDGKPMAFEAGTLMVPVQMQTANGDKIFETLKAKAEKYNLTVQAVASGAALSGVDLGSSRMAALTRPNIAMLVGNGVSATDAGEVWHLLDQRMNIPSSHLEVQQFNRMDAGKYNVLVMVGGDYGDLSKEKLRAWVSNGGTLIAMEEAISWAAQNGITDVKFKKAASPIDSSARFSYIDREQVSGAQQIAGAIFGAEIDATHPLSFGYQQKTVSLFKANRVFMEKSKNPFGTPFYYGSKPLQSGWVSRENGDAIKNSAAVLVSSVGSGRVINIADNPNFRAFWLGGSKLFMNAIFFSRMIDPATGR